MDQKLVNHFTWLANTLAECNTYPWSPEFKENELRKAFDKFYKSMKGLDLDLEKLTVDELKEMRFCKWDEESDLWLIPLWFVPLLPVGIELTTISGAKVTYTGDNIDLDIRFGCTAYGILKGENGDEKAPYDLRIVPGPRDACGNG